MVIIFSFSAENSKESSNTSDKVLYPILDVVVEDFDEMSESDREHIAESFSYIIRKCAHFIIYTILGFLVYSASGAYHVSEKIRYLISQAFSTLYSVTDEIHQYFVPGRACAAFDVFIDSAGALSGILICMLLLFVIRKKRKI